MLKQQKPPKRKTRSLQNLTGTGQETEHLQSRTTRIINQLTEGEVTRTKHQSETNHSHIGNTRAFIG